MAGDGILGLPGLKTTGGHETVTKVEGAGTDHSDGLEDICPPGYHMCSECCDSDASCECDSQCANDAHVRCTFPHRQVQNICPPNFTVCPNCCDRNPSCKCDPTCGDAPSEIAVWSAVLQTITTEKDHCVLPHRAIEELCPVGFISCPHCCDRNLDCKCDDYCAMGPTGSTTDSFRCTVPHKKDTAICPPNYFVCPDCCDKSDTCKCDKACGTNPNEMCTAPRIVEDAKCPAGFFICPKCCDRNPDCKCDSFCGYGPTGYTTRTFACTAPHRSEAKCPVNFTMCQDCCDRNEDCSCDHYCGMGPTGSTTKDFKCSMPHRNVDESKNYHGGWGGSVFSFATILVLGGLGYVGIRKIVYPKATPPPLLEAEMRGMDGAGDGGAAGESGLWAGGARQARQVMSGEFQQL
eukprot:TRINITY_DN6461_c0_g2_i1.p1 TRINITY_DN6461_c0_g2~~TRINITY_DN6461_c0_g2_i1.p1  ORF type:complete len:445 (+),score=51.05 TRINITY_DN6461_c0_g2_i1:118-1335(+)